VYNGDLLHRSSSCSSSGPRSLDIEDIQGPLVKHVAPEPVAVAPQALDAVDAGCTHEFCELKGPAVNQVLDLHRIGLRVQPLCQFGFLGGNAPGTLATVAGTADPAAHGNERRSPDINGIGPEADDLGHICALPDAAAGDDGYFVPYSLLAQLGINACNGYFDRDPDMVPEDHRRRTGPTAEPVYNNGIGR